MCNFSNNNNKSATSTSNQQQAKTPTTLELIKMVAELAAIDHAVDSMFYTPIPIFGNIQVKIGDIDFCCTISNDAAKEKKQPIQQQKLQPIQQQKLQETQTNTQYQQKITEFNQQLSEKFRRLYSLITDFLGSYTRAKISIAPGCSSDSIRLGFINKGESVVKEIKGETPFFGVESIPLQKYFSKNFESFSIFPRGDAFSVTIKGDEAAVSKLMEMVKEHIYKNKRAVEWARYNY